jgi:hypothetical protein
VNTDTQPLVPAAPSVAYPYQYPQGGQSQPANNYYGYAPAPAASFSSAPAYPYAGSAYPTQAAASDGVTGGYYQTGAPYYDPRPAGASGSAAQAPSYYGGANPAP